MSFKQKEIVEDAKVGFKVWILCLVAGVAVAILMYPILFVAGFTLGPMVAVLGFVLMFPLLLVATGYMFRKFYK